MINRYKRNENIKLSENFGSVEFDCNCKGCCNETFIDTELVKYCQTIRDHFGAPVIVNSGYRCKTHNKNVGGSSKSKHMEGMAADIRIKGVEPCEIAKYAESLGIKGIGLYETSADGYFVHIDTRPTKYFWYGQKAARRTTFGGGSQMFSVSEWQKAAIKDGFDFPKYGADGKWGSECEAVAKKAICKKRIVYKYQSLTALVQKAVGVTADGKFGNATKTAVKEWQRANGLSADGCVGPATWKKMIGV